MSEVRLQHSLKHRIMLSTLLVFLVSVWTLSYFASRMLRQDMERLLADQQSSTVAYVAAELNHELENRVHALDRVSRSISIALLDNPAALQKLLEKQSILQDLFNSGVVAVTLDGMAVADVPMIAGRRGTNYASNVATRTALAQGHSVIDRVVVGRILQQPLFNINSPILDDQGKVIGALFGVINLAMPNFLDSIGENRYGKSGGYLVMDLQQKIIVTATDPTRILQPLPATGINELSDRRLQGFTAAEVAVNSQGVELLSSASPVPAAGWLVVATLPTKEAFAPIRDMQQRIVFFSIVLTLLATAVSWWLLRRQFAPLISAVDSLTGISEPGKPLQPLLVASQDEIGQLLKGFNHVLATLGERESQLKTERDFFSAVLQQSSDGVIVFDPHDLSISEANPSICRILGHEREALGKLKYSELLDDDPAILRENVRHLCQDKNLLACERQFRKKDETRVAMEVNACLIETGGRQFILVNLRDLTERKEKEALLQASNVQLKQARVTADKANLAKSEFLSTMSHELRSPLNAVLGFAQLLESAKTPPSKEQQLSIEQILKAGWYLLELINEILDLARIESGKVMVSHEAMSLSEVFADSHAMIEAQAQQHGIRVIMPDPSVAHYIKGDETAVKQVMINLLSNAIKYNRAGGTVMVCCDQSGENFLRVSVKDGGSGLSASQVSQLFQPFNRLGQETGKEEGTGIGLVVTKQLVELMGGVMGVSSTVGVGSEFWFDLPIASTPMSKPDDGGIVAAERTSCRSTSSVGRGQDSIAI